MGELTLLGDSLTLERPEAMCPAESNTEAKARSRILRDLVWDKTPKHLLNQPVRSQFRPLLDDWQWGVSWVLLGPTGAGKSTACVHLVRTLLQQGRDDGGEAFARAKSIFWTRADSVTAAGGQSTEEAALLLRRAEYSRLMILDDLAVPSKTLLRVIQQRYDARRPLVVTSGARTAEQFQELVGGEAVTRWILDCGGIRKGAFLGDEQSNDQSDERQQLSRSPTSRRRPSASPPLR